MVVFKKRSMPGATATTQNQEPVDKDSSTPEAATSSTPSQKQHPETTITIMRYSDVAADRKSTLNVTPIKKLLDTFELCEQVLDYLSMKEVLLATRVCRALKTNIQNSSLLQAKLFLAPDLTIKNIAVSSQGTLLSGLKAEESIATTEASDKRGSFVGQIMLYTIHPALQAGRMLDRYKQRGIVECAKLGPCETHCEGYQGLTFRDCELRSRDGESQPSSLYQMYLSQPPIKRVGLAVLREDRGWFWHIEKVHNEHGVTFKEVLQVAKRTSRGDPRCRLVDVGFSDGFAVSAETREAVEKAGELSSEDDPTRWVQKSDIWVLKGDGFAIL